MPRHRRRRPGADVDLVGRGEARLAETELGERVGDEVREVAPRRIVAEVAGVDRAEVDRRRDPRR